MSIPTTTEESQMKHHFRNLFLILALIITGVYGAKYHSCFLNSIFKQWFHHLLWASGILTLLIFGLDNTFRITAKKTLIFYRKQILPPLLGTSIVVVSYYIVEHNASTVSVIGLLFFFLIFSWTLATVIPFLSKSKNNKGISKDANPDRFHRMHFVERFTGILKDSFEDHPDSLRKIAITGAWGVGKTDFIERTIANLKKDQTSHKIQTSFINPWVSRSDEDAYKILIGGIGKALGIWSPNGKTAKFFCQIFAPFFGLQGISKTILQAINDTDIPSSERKLKAINDKLKCSGHKIVVFADDMERVSVDKVLQVFPAIDRLKNLTQCTFVFALDHKRLIKAFEDEKEAKGYLDKVFDAQLSLPQPDRSEIKDLVLEYINPKTTPYLHQAIEPLTDALPLNPRQIKQWIQLCQLDETMFLQNIYEPNEKNFPAFFLTRLLEIEFIGFNDFITQPWVTSSLTQAQKLNHEQHSREFFGLSEREDDSSSESDHIQINYQAYLNQEAPEKERFDFLIHYLHELIKQSDDRGYFTFTWASGGYKKLAGLPGGFREKALAIFEKNSNQNLLDIVSETFKDEDHTGSEEAGSLLAEIIIRKNITSPLLPFTPQTKELNSAKTWIKLLTTHLQRPENSEGGKFFTDQLYDQWLELHSNFENIEKFDSSLIDLAIALNSAWIPHLSFGNRRGLLILVKTNSAPYNLSDPNKIYRKTKWGKQLENDLLKHHVKALAKAFCTPHFWDYWNNLESRPQDPSDIISDPRGICPKKLLIKYCNDGNSKFSHEFVRRILHTFFDPRIEYENFEANLKMRKETEDWYSFISLPMMPSIEDSSISNYTDRIKSLYSKIDDEDLKTWFKESFLNKDLSEQLNLDEPIQVS